MIPKTGIPNMDHMIGCMGRVQASRLFFFWKSVLLQGLRASLGFRVQAFPLTLLDHKEFYQPRTYSPEVALGCSVVLPSRKLA